MSNGFITPIFDQIKAEALDKLPDSIKPQFATVHDKWYLGTELVRDIGGEQNAASAKLPAVVLVPMDFPAEEANAQHRAQEWKQPLHLFYIYRRGPHVSEVEQSWATPLHEALSQWQIHEGLAGLRFYDSMGRKIGRVIHFHTMGPPDFEVDAENRALYPLGLACFRIKLLVECLIAMDADNKSLSGE